MCVKLESESKKMKTKLNRDVVVEKSRQTVLEKELNKMYNEMYPTIKKLMRKHKVSVSEESFLQIATYSYIYDIVTEVEKEETSKENIINRLENAIIITKNNGKKNLNSISNIKIFEKVIKDFKEIRTVNKEKIKVNAYHEAGHFILNEEMGEIKGRTQCISVIDISDVNVAGINITSKEIGKEHMMYTLESTIKIVAMYLAGDISCEVFLGQKDEGILQDYEIATRRIHTMLLCSRIRTKGKYLCNRGSHIINGSINYTALTEKQREELAKQTSKIMMKAERKAKRILKKKRKQVKILVEALIERGALTGEQARQLYYGEIKLSDLPPAKINYIK